MNKGIVIALSILGGLAALFMILRSTMGAVRKKLEAHVEEKFDKKEIVAASTGANFFGQQSKGGRQIRGNGALVLTKEALYFVRAAPLKEFSLPIQSITEVTLPRSFAGKSIFSALLCIHYRADEQQDAMAWAIKDPKQWKAAIEALMRSHAKTDHRTE